MRFTAGSSLSLPSEAPVKRLRRHGFGALPPGIESLARPGGDKLRPVADQANMIRRYVPFVQNIRPRLRCQRRRQPNQHSIEKRPGSFL
jgi:hypothetical protein